LLDFALTQPFLRRHDLPFYLPHFVELQKSFLDAFLKGEDDRGWLEGPNAKVPAVNLLVREGNPGWNSNEAEATFGSRPEAAWPLERTKYTKYHLHPSSPSLQLEPATEPATIEMDALGKGQPIHFRFKFEDGVELTGHPLATLAVSVKKRADGTHPKDVDMFVTLRHFDPTGAEVFYTGTAGDPVPLCKGKHICLSSTTPALALTSLLFSQAGCAPRFGPSTRPIPATATTFPAATTSPPTCPTLSPTRSTACLSSSGRPRSRFRLAGVSSLR
jgi:hypothetical protein